MYYKKERHGYTIIPEKLCQFQFSWGDIHHAYNMATAHSYYSDQVLGKMK